MLSFPRTPEDEVRDLVQESRVMLARQLHRLTQATDELSGTGNFERRIASVARTLRNLEERGDIIGSTLRGLHEFASFCVKKLDRDEMRAVSKALRLFIDDMRKRAG